MGTLCVSGAVLAKTGTIISGATAASTENFDFAILQAEGTVCGMTRTNWIDIYATIEADTKYILEDVTSALAANQMINANVEFFDNVIEAEDKMTINRDTFVRGLSILRDEKVRTFVKKT